MPTIGSLHVHEDIVIDEEGEEKVILQTEMEVTYMSHEELKKMRGIYGDDNLWAEQYQRSGFNEHEGKTLYEEGPGGMPGVPRISYRNPKTLTYYQNLKIKNA